MKKNSLNGSLRTIRKRIADKKLELDIIEKMTTLATAGLGLVAALAWNSAIQDTFTIFFPDRESLPAKYLYAIIVTILIVLVTTKLGQLSSKIKESIQKDEEQEARKSN